ncbi:MAG TPA: hypothetical protein VFE13_04020 [Caulobacteraceae bacterium]|jgi:Dyp-type peroxidase family|nr:hypothetical protein [Caulobacteraceae bacterium]
MSPLSNDGRIEHARQNIQANLVRPVKYADGGRDWSLFYFFRIMTKNEVDETVARAAAAFEQPENPSATEALLLDLEQPSLVSTALTRGHPLQAYLALPGQGADVAPAQRGAGLASAQQAAQPAQAAPQPPPQNPPDPRPEASPRFRSWLKLLASADKAPVIADTQALQSDLPPHDRTSSEGAKTAAHALLGRLASREAGHAILDDKIDFGAVRQFLDLYAGILVDPASYRELLKRFGDNPRDAGASALAGGLCGATTYELLRQGAPAFAHEDAGAKGLVRGEAHARAEGTANAESPYDPIPINVAFTYAGLEALGLDPTTLASFPEPFKQGMAARAVRLNDVGPSAPENWEREYGLPSMHGFFTGGFPAGGPGRPIKEAVWAQLRREVEAFNHHISNEGRVLRTLLGALFRPFGLEILRIELGQDPYQVDEHGDAVAAPYRMEHFGFNDGLSQPFVDLALGDPPAGGGTPDVDGSWSPVAPGEIYLDLEDEDGEVQTLPVSPELRRGGTYIVLRKLEQDVSGFHAFLARQRPSDADAQTRLAAQMVGRWPNGTPLSLSPDVQRRAGSPAKLNDFRYAQDDPMGRRCPLGAHIRRTNPRDTGGRGEVRRHRILRRGVSYGGPLLTPGSLGDGKKRGLLFIAVNSRIDLQFEVIQADWINGGELLGQAGLGRCPLVGGNQGAVEDSFMEAGAVAPVVGLPSFVTTRGGDYFFAPGIGALQQLAEGCAFPVERTALPYGGFAMGGAATPSPFDRDRLTRYAGKTLAANPGHTAVRLTLPPAAGSRVRPPIVFVGQYDDVVRVLSDRKVKVERRAGGAQAGAVQSEELQAEFTTLQYRIASERITRGYDFIAGTESVGATAKTRGRLLRMLGRAWEALGPSAALALRVRTIAERRLQRALRRTASTGRIDLVHDLATQAAYAVVTELYGVPGPEWLTELAPALPFGGQHIAGLPPDWLAGLKGTAPADPGLTSMQIWGALILGDMLGNPQSDHEAQPFSRQAGSEMLSQVDQVLAAAADAPPGKGPPATLVESFARLAPGRAGQFSPAREAYLREAAVLLTELICNTLCAVPAAFGNVFDFLLRNRIDLARLMPLLIGAPRGVERLIREADRLNPVTPLLTRTCGVNGTVLGGETLATGDMVAALVQVANLDPRKFANPMMFSLGPLVAGHPARDLDAYLTFGAPGGAHPCWGRDPVALPVLEACVVAAAQLRDLHRVAGPAGSAQSLAGITIGLPARFRR